MNDSTIKTKQLPLFDLNEPVKTCLTCKQVFSATSEFFHRNKNRKDGLNPICKKCNIEKVSQWAEVNPEKRREIGTRWRENNRERMRELSRKHYWENPEKNAKRKRLARKNNPEKFRTRYKQYAQNNPEKIQAKRLRHIALKASAEGDFTGDDIKCMTEEQGGCCYYCGDKTKLTVDHKTPLSRGGSNSPANLCMACGFCNSQKGGKTEAEYREWLRIIGE